MATRDLHNSFSMRIIVPVGPRWWETTAARWAGNYGVDSPKRRMFDSKSQSVSRIHTNMQEACDVSTCRAKRLLVWIRPDVVLLLQLQASL